MVTGPGSFLSAIMKARPHLHCHPPVQSSHLVCLIANACHENVDQPQSQIMVEFYKRLWAVSGPVQILLIILSLSIAGLAAVPLQLQKDIVNGLTAGISGHKLLLLGAAYLAASIINCALKFAMQYRSSTLSESVIKRIRAKILEDATDANQSSSVGRGRLVTMVAAEAEKVGSFAGEAISTPVLQLGTLLSVISFVTVTQPYLGLLILGIILPQALIVLTLQKYINQKVAARVKVLRQATNQIGSEDLEKIQQAVLDDFEKIFLTRCQIFKLKLSMKFVNSLIFGFGIVAILMLGGFLVLEGKSDVGTLVASLTAMKSVNQPWHELIAFYRQLSAVRVGFDLLLQAMPQSK